MLMDIILILGLLYVAIQFADKFKIATPISLIIGTFFIKSVYPTFLNFTNTEIFAEEGLALIILLVLADAFILKLRELQKNWKEIAFLAIGGVFLSIGMGVMVQEYIFPEYNLGLGVAIVFFAMNIATDPVSVVSVMNQFKIPHKLKIYAEGESLFNDPAALILFSAFGLYMATGQDITASYIATVTTEIYLFSALVGLIIGFIGIGFLRYTKDVIGELVLIILVAYVSFTVAEHIYVIGHNHLAGLLSEIVAILTMTTVIDKSLDNEQKSIEKDKEEIINNYTYPIGKFKSEAVNKLNHLITDVSDSERQDDVLRFLMVFGMIAIAILFASIAEIVVWENLIIYKWEIIKMFLLTTLIRFIVVGSFAWFKKIPYYWMLVLFFAGIKGGLSIVMLQIFHTNLPDFEHREMFEAVVFGIILLSTFVYVTGLTATIMLNQLKFKLEYDTEHAEEHEHEFKKINTTSSNIEQK